MKSVVYLLLLTLLGLQCGSCKKADSTGCTMSETAPATEVESVQSYLNTQGITAEKDNRGFFYTIENPGTDKYPNACSNVTVDYIGKLVNGNIFDQNTNVTFDLSSLIKGWREGIPLIKEGGKITLYLPPSLGYGSDGYGSSIPPNSITIFSITLHKINK
jgi:FKBP-type peptidyl-prolyl cis-trans isomerase FkpA